MPLRWTEAVAGLEDRSNSDRLKKLDLFAFGGRLLRTDLILVWKIFNDKLSIKADQICQLSPLAGMRRHPYKIFVPQSRLDLRRRFFSVRTISRWNSLAANTVCANTLENFESRLKAYLVDVLYNFS